MSVVKKHWLATFEISDLLFHLVHEPHVILLVRRTCRHKHGLFQAIADSTKDSNTQTGAGTVVINDVRLARPGLGLHLPGVKCSFIHIN